MLLASVLWLAGTRPAVAQATAEGSVNEDSGSTGSADGAGWPDNGPGIQFRLGHIEGQGIPQDLSITPLEVFPYLLWDETLLFGDFRLFPTNDGTFGGNAGMGGRYYSRDLDSLLGASLWYDADGTRSEYLQQVGLSLEAFTGPMELRTNFYLPVGDTEPESSVTVLDGSTQFVGESIVYDQVRSNWTAMAGADLEAGLLLPGGFAAEHDLRVYAGGYYFADEHGNEIPGASARAQAHVLWGIDAEVRITHDAEFDTRAFVGVSWTFGPLRPAGLAPATPLRRMAEHVTRNYTVVARERDYVEAGLIAEDPTTGLAYQVAHVASDAAPGGSGTVESPFQTIVAGQASGADFVFVHAGSEFGGADGSLVLADGERIFGDGDNVVHYVAVRELGTLRLPHGPTGGDRPVLMGAAADGVELASHSELAGFTIRNATGSGLVGTGVEDVLVRDVEIVQPGGDGVRLITATGTLELEGVTVTAAGGDALAIEGGSATIHFSGSLRAGTGHSLVVENTVGGEVDLSRTVFDGSGGEGITLGNNAGDVTLQEVNLTGTVGPAIEIDGGSGDIMFLGLTRITQAGGDAVAVANLAAEGTVTFDDLTVEQRQLGGVAVDNVAGRLTVEGTTTISNEAGSLASALEIENSSGTFSFGQFDVTDAAGAPGVSLTNNSGATTFDTLNVESQSGTALFADHAGTLAINPSTDDGTVNASQGGTIVAAAGAAIDVEATELEVNLTSVSSSGAATAGLRLVDTTGALAVLGDGEANSGGTIQGAPLGVLLENAGDTTLQWMRLDSNGVGIQAVNVGDLTVYGSEVLNSTAFGLDTLNATTVTVRDSSFTYNGEANIRGQFDQAQSYGYTLAGSLLTSNTADNLVLTSVGGGDVGTLNLLVQGNEFENTLAGTTGVRVNWNGLLSATVDANSFLATSGGHTGIGIANASTSAASTFNITSNTFDGTGGQDTAVSLAAGPEAYMYVGFNDIELSGSNATGVRLSLGGVSDVLVSSNAIADASDGATGLLFDTVGGASNIQIDSNLIDLENTGNLLDRGIIFEGVADTITLNGTADNDVSGADATFLIPAGMTSGGIYVNGAFVP